MSAIDQVSSDARELHSQSIVIDACSFFCLGYGDLIEESGVTALALTTPWPWDNFETAVQRTEDYYQLVNRDSRFRLIETAEDIRQAKASNQVGIILCAQSPSPVGDRLGRVETMARLGFRVMQVTYSGRNLVGDGCNEPTNVGLSLFGRELVQEMNRCGILVDLSHAGVRTALEAVEISTEPVIVSHANPYELYRNPRNIRDELINAVAESGGVIGLTPFAALNWNGDPAHQPTLEDYLQAIAYVVERVGIEHVGIGTDSEATERAYPQAVRDEIARRYRNLTNTYSDIFGPDAPGHVAGFRGLRGLPLITEALFKRGYPSEDVVKVLGGNFLRVYEAVWPR